LHGWRRHELEVVLGAVARASAEVVLGHGHGGGGAAAGRQRGAEARAAAAWLWAGAVVRWLGRSTAAQDDKDSADAALGHGGWIIWVAPEETEKETTRSPETTHFLPIGRSDGSDRTLPPSIQLIPERSKTPRIMTGCVRSPLTGRSQSSVDPDFVFFARSDAGSPSDRTLGKHCFSVRSLLPGSSSPPVN